MDTATVPSVNGQAAAATDAAIAARLARDARIAALRANGWKVQLSGGHHATLSDPEALPERKARAIKVAMLRSTPRAPTSDTGSIDMDADAVIDSGYIVVAAFLSAWSRGEVATVANFEPLLDLPSRDYSALQAACEDLRDEAFTDYAPSAEALRDPASPFGAPSA